MPRVVMGFFNNTSSDSIYISKQFWITVGVALIATPAFFRDLSSLKYTAMIAVVSVFYLVIVVVTLALKPLEGMPPHVRWEDITWFKLDISFFTALPILVFGFTCRKL